VDKKFYLIIRRKSTGEAIFDTTNQGFLYSDRYIQLSSSTEGNSIDLLKKNNGNLADYLYGWGERRARSFRYQPGNYTTWNDGQGWNFE